MPSKFNGVLQQNFLSSSREADCTMKQKRFTETQIMQILKQAEGGVPVEELCREHDMSRASFYKWRTKCGGMDASMISQIKALAQENPRLKKIYAEISLENDLLEEALGKKW